MPKSLLAFMLGVGLCVSFVSMDVRADEGTSAGAPSIDPAKISSLTIDPPTITLDHARAVQRVLVTAMVDGKPIDVTSMATLASSNEAVLAINDLHEAVPKGDGSAELTATLGIQKGTAAVTVVHSKDPRPISFLNEIEPVMSKLTCNSGGCHGKAAGQNGFKLSLLGYQPEADYDYLVKEGRGRRLFPAAPEHSLLLRKATGELPHGGGKRMKRGDHSHQLVSEWIRQGMPYGANDPTVTRIDIFPPDKVMDRQSAQHLRVTATYSDGRQEDVTRQVQFQSNDDGVASIDEKAMVSSHDRSGEAAIMARYMGQVAVFRASVPLGKSLPEKTDFVAVNGIDERTSKKWSDLGIVPSRHSTDQEFVRRVYVDLCGRLPKPSEVTSFLDSKEQNKREKLVDQLLDSPDYASHMAMKWGAILQNKRSGRPDYVEGTHAMSLWLKDAFSRDVPYDQFVRAILTASGTAEDNPPVTWYRQVRTPIQNVDSVTQLFLGTRIQCAQCHHHPFEKWGQDDYFSFAAFFSRIGRKEYDKSAVNGEGTEAVFVQRSGEVKSPVTGKVMKPAGLGATPVDVPAGQDPRGALVDWMTSADNPFFARALVNRIWGHFFSRGIVEPIDDMRVTNPPTNPELLDWLSKDFVTSGYSIKHLVKSIVMSSTYQLASEPNEFNKQDTQNFARYYPKRLPAEVLLDSIDTVTEVKTAFNFPDEMRAVDLPDENVGSYFLDIFGRPQRQSSCECERTDDANLSQALHLLNSKDIQTKLVDEKGRASKLAADARPDADKIRDLYVSFFARPPREEELKVATDYLNSKPDKKSAYQNLIWALINTKEFQFNI